MVLAAAFAGRKSDDSFDVNSVVSGNSSPLAGDSGAAAGNT